jgi:hypothetical protein
MKELSIKEVADAADLIVNGYAFTKTKENIRVLNLNNTKKSLVLSNSADVLETTMDDIEISIVLDYYEKNRKYMEVKYA